MALVATLTHPEIPAILDTPLGGSADVVIRQGTLAFDASYPTNGEVFAKAALGVDTVLFAWIGPSAGYQFAYDYANDKVKAFYSDNNNAGDGVHIEVPNATNLAALTAVPFFALCKVNVDHEADPFDIP